MSKPKLVWGSPSADGSDLVWLTNCGSYRLRRTPGNGRGELFSASHLQALPHQRRVVCVVRSHAMALEAINAHYRSLPTEAAHV